MCFLYADTGLRWLTRHALGYQYAAYYVSDVANVSVRHPTLARRAFGGENKAWESFSFMDYNQTEDDGHDM